MIALSRKSVGLVNTRARLREPSDGELVLLRVPFIGLVKLGSQTAKQGGEPIALYYRAQKYSAYGDRRHPGLV